VSDEDEAKRAALAQDARMSTLSPQQTEEMMRNSYGRRANRERAREAWRKAQEKKNGTG
jgi:hypothetical protein